MEVNTSAVYLCVVAFIELLAEGNKRKNAEQLSQVIAVSSIGGFNRVPIAGFAYAASKAGTTHMMKQLATAFVPYDIRSNVIAPGSTSPSHLPPFRYVCYRGLTRSAVYPSEMASGPLLEAALKRGEDKVLKSVIPLQRTGTEEDMAGAVLYLTSKAGAYLNGNVLVTDGGRLGVLPSSY